MNRNSQHLKPRKTPPSHELHPHILRSQNNSRPVWQRVATDFLKFHPGPPDPTLLSPSGGQPPKRPYGRRAGGLWPSSKPLVTPRSTGQPSSTHPLPPLRSPLKRPMAGTTHHWNGGNLKNVNKSPHGKMKMFRRLEKCRIIIDNHGSERQGGFMLRHNLERLSRMIWGVQGGRRRLQVILSMAVWPFQRWPAHRV
jgi:hypothetical protein